MANVQITSLWPAQATTGVALSPAIKVQHLDLDPTATYFAMPVLLNATGDSAEGLQGPKSVPGSPVNGSCIEYNFIDLSISAPGAYLIRLDVYMITANTQGAQLVDQITKSITVVSN